MRVFSLVFMTLSVLLLACCGDGRASHGAKSLDKAKANFYRIQASYELIETGEQINFDYQVSAYNRDVVGSYSGVLFPHVMFEKSPSGQAIAIDPPRYYHRGGVERRHKEEMPAMMWYPDATDLTYGESYLSSDAYHSPRTKVRILDYSVTQSNRKLYNKWLKFKIKEDNGGTNHPWSLGCVTESSGPEAKSCKYLEMRGTKRVIPGLGPKELRRPVYSRAQWLDAHGRFGIPQPVYTAKVTVWPRDVFDRYMKAYEGKRSFKKRYYCYWEELKEPLLNPDIQLSKLSEADKLRQKMLKDISNDMRSADVAQTGSGAAIDRGRYLSLPVAQGKTKLMTQKIGSKNRRTGAEAKTGQFPIASIYPAIDHSVLTTYSETQEQDIVQVTQIVMTDEWRGFGLPSVPPITKLTDELPVVKPSGKYRSEIYINDKLICGSPYYKKSFVIYDLKLGQKIIVERA